MYTTILKIIWPYLQRFLAGKAAEYIQERRSRRLMTPEDAKAPAERPPSPPVETGVNDATITASPSRDAIWFALSGLVLGSAFSVMLYIILQDSKSRL